MKATYQLAEIAIRRRPRFGSGAGIWTTLLAPEDTRLETPEDFPTGSELDAHYISKVSFQWDKDLIREDRLDPRRLLINASTPYTFLTSDPEADECLLRNNPAWPCCTYIYEPVECTEYTLDLGNTPTIDPGHTPTPPQPGQRLPSYQTFKEGRQHATLDEP